MDVSVIIVNYHSVQMAIDCIRSIFQKTSNITYEIIVVDNASGDNSIEVLEQTFDSQITVIASEQNLGFGKANNLGAKIAQGKYLFLLNPDTILVNNAIDILFQYLEDHSEVGVAGGNLFAPDMSPAPSYCLKFDDIETERKSASWKEILAGKFKQKALNRSKKEQKLFENEFNYDDVTKRVAYIFGADMMLKKELFHGVGGFDPDFFMYAEEEELSWRITNNGYNIVSVPQAKIIHLEGATVKKQNEFSERQFKMRMNGALTYFYKRFGIDGAEQFYSIRTLRYQRLVRLAKLQGKLTDNFPPLIQKRCLKEVYYEFMEQNDKMKDSGGNKNGRGM